MSTPGTARRPTAADIAQEVGVSRATVGYVLNDTPGQTISRATRERVLEVAKRLGYRPRAAAQALASGRSRIVLLVLPEWPLDHSMRRYIEEASIVLDEAGYALVTWTPHARGRARPLWELLDPDVVIGFAPFSDTQVRSIQQHGITNLIPDPEDTNGPAAERGPVIQVEHLSALGHRRIAVATTGDPRLASLAHARADRALEVAAEHGLATAEPYAVDTPGTDLPALVRSWMEEGVTGVVAYNDEVAAMIAGAAMSAGFRIPEDLSIIGHDDTPLASLFVPALSSVRFDNAALGRLVAELALAKVERRLPTVQAVDELQSLVARASTSVPRQGPARALARSR